MNRLLKMGRIYHGPNYTVWHNIRLQHTLPSLLRQAGLSWSIIRVYHRYSHIGNPKRPSYIHRYIDIRMKSNNQKDTMHHTHRGSRSDRDMLHARSQAQGAQAAPMLESNSSLHHHGGMGRREIKNAHAGGEGSAEEPAPPCRGLDILGKVGVLPCAVIVVDARGDFSVILIRLALDKLKRLLHALPNG